MVGEFWVSLFEPKIGPPQSVRLSEGLGLGGRRGRMMRYAKPIFCGLAVAAMAGAIGLPSFTAEWWVYLIAGNTLAAFCGR